MTGVDKNEQPGPQAITDGVHHVAISEDTPSVPTTLCAEQRDQTQKQLYSTITHWLCFKSPDVCPDVYLPILEPVRVETKWI